MSTTESAIPTGPQRSTALNSDCPCPDRLLTVIQSFILNGRVFRPQEQYCYDEDGKGTRQVRCGGCTVPKYTTVTVYKVTIAQVQYEFRGENVVETRFPIEKGIQGQDFNGMLETLGNPTNRQYNLPPDQSAKNRAAFNKVIM